MNEKKQRAIQQEMEKLKIYEKDLIEKFVQGSGKGGQKINKTSNCVYLKHKPSGIMVRCQKDRKRETNRFLARQALIEKIKEEILKQKTKKQQEAEKIRRQKKRRSRKTQIKLLEDKKRKGQIKKLRQLPKEEE